MPYLAPHLERFNCTTYLFLNHWIAHWIGCQATFSRQKRKNLLAKRKRRLLLARLRLLLEISHYKQRRFITTRMPQTESRVEFQGISREEWKEGLVHLRRLLSAGSVNSGKLFTALCLSFFICKRGWLCWVYWLSHWVGMRACFLCDLRNHSCCYVSTVSLKIIFCDLCATQEGKSYFTLWASVRVKTITTAEEQEERMESVQVGSMQH